MHTPEILAFSITALPQQLGTIFYTIVFPLLILVLLGFVVQRRMGVDMPTMTRLNFQLVIPGMIYFVVLTSPLRMDEVWSVIWFELLFLTGISLITLLVALVQRVPRGLRPAMQMTALFHNSGNYGLPLQKLAFDGFNLGGQAFALQVVVMLGQNLLTFTLGIVLAAAGSTRDRHIGRSLLQIARFPPLYALAAAITTVQLCRWWGFDPARLPANPAEVPRAIMPFWEALLHIKNAFICLALFTLGAQLALVKRGARRYPVTSSVLVRLIGGPLLGFAIVYLLGLHGALAQILIVSTAMPSAINAMLLCMEFDNHPDYVAQAVFYSTLLSPITVTVVIFLVQGGFFARLAL